MSESFDDKFTSEGKLKNIPEYDGISEPLISTNTVKDFNGKELVFGDEVAYSHRQYGGTVFKYGFVGKITPQGMYIHRDSLCTSKYPDWQIPSKVAKITGVK